MHVATRGLQEGAVVLLELESDPGLDHRVVLTGVDPDPGVAQVRDRVDRACVCRRAAEVGGSH